MFPVPETQTKHNFLAFINNGQDEISFQKNNVYTELEASAWIREFSVNCTIK